MTTEHEEQPVICSFCKKRPMNVTYTNPYNRSTTEELCAICHDRFELEYEYDVEYRKRSEWLYDERADEFFAWLDEFEATHRHRDHEGWFAHRMATTRHHELWWAERYEEAIAAYAVVKQLVFDQPWKSWGSAHCQALALEALGRHEEALAAFEEAFRNQEPPNYVATSEDMHLLVKFSANAGKPVDESWRELIKAVAAEFRLEFPERPTLAESIMALYEVTHKICNPTVPGINQVPVEEEDADEEDA